MTIQNTQKITAEARRHLITKSAVSYRVTVRTFSMTDGSQDEMSVNVSGSFASDIEMLSFVAGRYTTKEIAVVPVALKPIEKIEDRRAMYDDDFFRYGHILKDGEKVTDCMVRTLTLSTVKCLSADFENQTFTHEMIQEIGDYETSADCISWHSKRHPEDTKVYGKFEEIEKQEIKVILPVKDFFEHSFSINNTGDEA